MDGSNIPHLRYCGPHIPYPTLFLTSHFQNIWTNTSQIQRKLCSLCILFVLNHDIAHSFVISTIFPGRIEFSSDGKGIDNFFVLIIYMFQEPKNIFYITSAQGGGILCFQSPGPGPYQSGIIHQETTTVTSNTALAETMTNLILVFIVAWNGNGFSVPLSVPLAINQAQRSRFMSQVIQLQQYLGD